MRPAPRRPRTPRGPLNRPSCPFAAYSSAGRPQVLHSHRGRYQTDRLYAAGRNRRQCFRMGGKPLSPTWPVCSTGHVGQLLQDVPRPGSDASRSPGRGTFHAPRPGTLTLLRLVQWGLREPAACVTGGLPERRAPSPIRGDARRPPEEPAGIKAHHNDHRREPSFRYSPQVSPWHTAAGTIPTGSRAPWPDVRALAFAEERPPLHRPAPVCITTELARSKIAPTPKSSGADDGQGAVRAV
jgi:hypothetical protein